MFKNLTVYRFDPISDNNQRISNTLADNEIAEELIENYPPIDPSNQEIMRCGWLPLEPLLIEMATIGNSRQRFLPLSMIIRQRAIDNGAVELAVRRMIAKIQKDQNRTVGKKEKTEIKNDILFDMIPKAPVKEKRVNGYVCGDGQILVDAVGKSAEDYISFVRESFGGLAALQLDIGSDEQSTEALIHNYVIKAIENEHFNFDEDDIEKYQFKFTNTFAFINDKEQIAIKDCAPSTMNGEFFGHVKEGQVVWCNFDNADVEFRLMSDLSLKALKFNMDFEDTDDQEATVATHRVQIQVYNKLVNAIVAEIELANEVEADE